MHKPKQNVGMLERNSLWHDKLCKRKKRFKIGVCNKHRSMYQNIVSQQYQMVYKQNSGDTARTVVLLKFTQMIKTIYICKYTFF